MPPIQALTNDYADQPWGRLYRGDEHGDLPVDDPPPVDHPTESYRAWRPSAIYDLAPFSQPFIRR